MPDGDADRRRKLAQNEVLIVVATLVWAVTVGFFPSLAVWGIPLAAVIVWSLAYSWCPNLVRYGTVLTLVAFVGFGVLMTFVILAREEARRSTTLDRLRGQGRAFQTWQMLQEGQPMKGERTVESEPADDRQGRVGHAQR